MQAVCLLTLTPWSPVPAPGENVRTDCGGLRARSFLLLVYHYERMGRSCAWTWNKAWRNGVHLCTPTLYRGYSDQELLFTVPLSTVFLLRSQCRSIPRCVGNGVLCYASLSSVNHHRVQPPLRVIGMITHLEWGSGA
ncbi:hypothetical protein BDW60DRAFT_182592 [Aspergillus nidulans var. acristatus]